MVLYRMCRVPKWYMSTPTEWVDLIGVMKDEGATASVPDPNGGMDAYSIFPC